MSRSSKLKAKQFATQISASLSDEQVIDIIENGHADSKMRQAAHHAMKSRNSLVAFYLRFQNQRMAEYAANAEREEFRSQQLVQMIEEATAALIKAGWVLETTSGNSRYFVKGSRRTRVSDHEAPATDERLFAISNGGFSWVSRGIVVTDKRWKEMLESFIEDEVTCVRAHKENIASLNDTDGEL